MRGVLVLILILAVAMIAVLAYLSLMPSPKPPGEPQNGRDAMHGQDEAGRVNVFKPSYKDDRMVLEPKSISVPPGRTKLFAAVSELIRDERLFPKGVKLLGAEVKGKTAELNFSEELRAGYSTDEEEALLKSLSATVGQFLEVENMRILVAGSPVDTLGNVDLSDPVPVTRNPKG
ncbi:MAG: GerMN domain-containing protein [Fimbriimonadia bacterium]|jgi:hypothetical protein